MRKNPNRIIKNAEDYLAIENNRNLLYSFLEKFSQCEVYSRHVLIQYRKLNGEETDPDDIGLDLKEIRDAFNENGIYFADNRLLTRIFGAEKTKGKSSCRWLRNKITHELMLRAITEVCDRSVDLLADMNDFISQINEQS